VPISDPSSLSGVLVSVVIPLYNHERYIEECLNSVLDQNIPNIELLLIDDGSSDKGFDVACRWKAKHSHRFARIEFVKQTNAGITKTFDRLIRKSTGRFVLILASDDALLPDSISLRINEFLDDSVMAVFGDAVPINDASQAIGKSAIGELGNPSSKAALRDPRTLPWELIFRWNVYGSVVMFRRESLINSDGSSILNLDIYSEDMQLYYKFASCNALRYLDKPVAKYRIHSENTSGTSKSAAVKLRKNIYYSRKHSQEEMPFFRGCLLGMQIYTFHRWRSGMGKWLAFPLVALSYLGIGCALKVYDFYRKIILGHRPN